MSPAKIARARVRDKARIKRMQAARMAIRDALKSVPCADCKQKFPPVCMDFDHRPGELKIRDVGGMFANLVSMDKIMKEVTKCDVVCSNCHRIRTRDRDHGRFTRKNT